MPRLWRLPARPDRAAGGAPPESGERVVRFGTARLRHRNRVVTARDFEDLATGKVKDVAWIAYRESAKTSIAKIGLAWLIARPSVTSFT